jgi:hypothetical protein
MDDDDIVHRLRLWAEGVQNQKAVVLAVAITEAAAEIERLRAERDEARRMCCEHATIDESGYVKHGTMLHFAESRGWDCFKEDKPCQ